MNRSTLYRGILQPIIIQLLEENGRMYGFEMTKLVQELTKDELQITEGALYPMLHKMEAEGILESEMEMVASRKRKYYKLTSEGENVAIHSKNEVADLIHNLQVIFKLKPI